MNGFAGASCAVVPGRHQGPLAAEHGRREAADLADAASDARGRLHRGDGRRGLDAVHGIPIGMNRSLPNGGCAGKAM